MNSEKPKSVKPEVIDTLLVINPDSGELDHLFRDLQTLGYPTITAQSLEEGLEFLNNKEVAVVILAENQEKTADWVESFRHIASNYPTVERILLTEGKAIESIKDVRRNAPLCSFLNKPWKLQRLQYYVERALEKHRLIYENQELHQRLLKQHVSIAKHQKILREELTLGGSVHKKMLIGAIPQGIQGFRAASKIITSKEVDGDFFEFMLPSSWTVDLFLGDVMGKGIPAALIGTAIKTQMIRYGIPVTRSHVMKRERVWEDDLFTPEEILEKVHLELIDQLIQFEYFASLFYARFYLKTRTLKYIDCGFAKPIHYVSVENRFTLLRGSNLPLGFSKECTYKSISINYSPGDFFIFYSDGLIDTKNPQGEVFGIERLIAIAQQYKDLPPDVLAVKISEDIQDFHQDQDFEDDITILVVGITNDQILSIQTPKLAKFKTDLSQLAAVRDFILRSCVDAPGDNKQLSEQMQLAINEIFCNIVKHGFKAKSFGEIVIQVELGQDGVSVEIADQGPPFNPEYIQEPSLAGDRYEGFGWYMVKKIVDKIVYQHQQGENGWNHLELFKSYILEGPQMEIGHATDDDIMIIVPRINALDAKDVPEFKEKMMNIIQNMNPKGVKKFILDLSQIEFVDSSGLGSFLSILRHIRDHGGTLRLANMNKSVRTIFELVSMHKVFETHETLEEAKKAFKN